MKQLLAACLLLLPAAASADCPDWTIACLQVENKSGAPVTFGHPFAKGAVTAETLAAQLDGKPVALQIDQPSSWEDGSLRFAVLTADAGSGDLALVTGSNGVFGPSPATPQDEIEVQLDLWAAQITLVTFGDREGNTPGIPFSPGERITLRIGQESHSLTVTPETAGGSHQTLTKLAQAFGEKINQDSRAFRAFKIGTGGGYEKMWLTWRAGPGQPFSVTAEYSGPAEIRSETIESHSPPRRLSAKLSQAQAAGIWLDGPLAREEVLVTPFLDGAQAHPHLEARFYRRAHAQGPARFDIVIENARSFVPGPRNYRYDARVLLNGEERAGYTGLNHLHHARWRQVIWSEGAEPAIRHDSKALIASRAVPGYDFSVRIPEETLRLEQARFAESDHGPLGNSVLVKAMPMAGGRPDLGPLPRWAVLYLLTQDPRMKQVVLSLSTAGASAPIHYRDEKTGLPVSLDDHPRMTMRFGQAARRDAFPKVEMGLTDWNPDAAHQPSMAYLPYLLTGDLFHLEELLYWANWNFAHLDPNYRDAQSGLLHPNEVRGQAWSLRTLGHAVHVAPDAHPMKGYFASRLRGNLDWYLHRYPRNGDRMESPALGWVEERYSKGRLAPWQNDFLVLSFAQLADMDFDGAAEMLRWLGQFSAGRWQAEGQGYCRAMAPAYWISVRPDKNGPFYPGWKELYRANWPHAGACPDDFIGGYPHLGDGYVAYGRAALAVMAEHEIPGALESWRRLVGETPKMTRHYEREPTWAITPRIKE